MIAKTIANYAGNNLKVGDEGPYEELCFKKLFSKTACIVRSIQILIPLVLVSDCSSSYHRLQHAPHENEDSNTQIVK